MAEAAVRGPARGPRVLVAPSRLGDVWCECGLPSVTTGSSCSHHCRRRGQPRARGSKVDEDTLAAAPLPPVRSNLTRKKKKSSNLDGRLHAAVTASLPRSVVDFSGGGEKWWMGPSLTPPPSPRRSRSLSPDRSNSPGGRGSCSTIAIAARKRE